mmetsp:Transcript_63540/g.151541  ORF Transcript_63540/g.151541 Transcript_63540/m.151541 type:complete len:338 (-) Transcript_63540:176-1189(-)
MGSQASRQSYHYHPALNQQLPGVEDDRGSPAVEPTEEQLRAARRRAMRKRFRNVQAQWGACEARWSEDRNPFCLPAPREASSARLTPSVKSCASEPRPDDQPQQTSGAGATSADAALLIPESNVVHPVSSMVPDVNVTLPASSMVPDVLAPQSNVRHPASSMVPDVVPQSKVRRPDLSMVPDVVSQSAAAPQGNVMRPDSSMVPDVAPRSKVMLPAWSMARDRAPQRNGRLPVSSMVPDVVPQSNVRLPVSSMAPDIAPQSKVMLPASSMAPDIAPQSNGRRPGSSMAPDLVGQAVVVPEFKASFQVAQRDQGCLTALLQAVRGNARASRRPAQTNP